jgi:uncharacterized protein
VPAWPKPCAKVSIPAPMSWSTSFACALVCALICAATAVTAATPPSNTTPAPKPPAPSSGTASSSAKTPRSGTPAAPTAAKGNTTRAKTPPPAKPKPKPNELQEIDWRDLLPEADRKKYNPDAPAPLHGPLGEGGPPAVQIVTTAVNDDLDQALVKLPGFIVPIGEAKNGVVREFYLVPYIGEDIHVPPPPSNQMVYVHSASGIALDAVHEAYWVTGKMRVETRTTPLGTSAWSMVANKVEQYQY